MRSLARERARRAEERGRALGCDQSTYDAALAVCSASSPAAVLAELGGSGDDPEQAAQLYAETMTLPRFRDESYRGALEGFRRQGFVS